MSNQHLMEDALMLTAAQIAVADVLDLIEDENLRLQIIEACAGYCAAFIIGATHAVQADAEKFINETINNVSMN